MKTNALLFLTGFANEFLMILCYHLISHGFIWLAGLEVFAWYFLYELATRKVVRSEGLSGILWSSLGYGLGVPFSLLFFPSPFK